MASESRKAGGRSSRLRWVLILSAFALVLASCATAGVSATVNGFEITDQDVSGLIAGSQDEVVTDAEQYRNLLTNAIVTAAMVSAADTDFGLEGLGTPEASKEFVVSASEQDLALIERVNSNAQFTDTAVDLVTVQLNVRASVKEALASETAFLEDVWQNDQNLLIQACARHVLVATEGEANEALARYEAGEDFSELATELSLDTQSPGGALPCPSQPANFVQPFSSVVATAPVGEVAGPIESEFGWHIVLVDSRESPQNLDELSQDPLKWVPAAIIDAEWIGWLNASLEAADIEVRSQIGMWYPPVDGIIPPPASPSTSP